MKKLLAIILIIIIILIIPIKTNYYDGGSMSLTSLTYKYIKWNKIDSYYDSGYKTGSEIHYFPNNFHTIDYYDDIKPKPLTISKLNGDIEEKIEIQSYNYKWCNQYNNCSELKSLMDSNFNSYKLVTVFRGDTIYYSFPGKITSIIIYDDMFKTTNEKVDYGEEYLNYLNLKGKKIIELNIEDTYGTAKYYYAVNIVN